MDNSIKLLIGVVGLAGLIAYVVPSGSPVPDPAAAPVAQAIAAPQILGLDPNLDAAKPVGEPIQVKYFKFGEPTIDGKPFGSVDEPRSSDSSRDKVVSQVAALPPSQPDMQDSSPVPPPEGQAIPAN